MTALISWEEGIPLTTFWGDYDSKNKSLDREVLIYNTAQGEENSGGKLPVPGRGVFQPGLESGCVPSVP